MIARLNSAPTRTTLVSLTFALALAGCKSKTATDDANVNMQVQARLFSDQNLSGQSIQAAVGNGIVTLSGNVTSDAARNAAASDAAQVAGVKTVVNNLVVQPGAVSAQVASPPPMPAPVVSTPAPAKTVKPSAASQQQVAQNTPAPVVRDVAPVQEVAPPPQPQYQQAPPPPPPPVIHNITLPAGTALPIRITQTLDSSTSQVGDRFSGAVASDIIVDNTVVLPQGTPVSGHVEDVKDAAHFKGSSLLAISLTSIERHGDRMQVTTDTYSKEGEGRGKNTAEKAGGGAVVGAVLGGIFGGGKGAAIGAAAGGGAGAGINGISRGQQVQIPSETVVRFRLSNPITVRVGPGGEHNDRGLEHHDNQ